MKQGVQLSVETIEALMQALSQHNELWVSLYDDLNRFQESKDDNQADSKKRLGDIVAELMARDDVRRDQEIDALHEEIAKLARQRDDAERARKEAEARSVLCCQSGHDAVIVTKALLRAAWTKIKSDGGYGDVFFSGCPACNAIGEARIREWLKD